MKATAIVLGLLIAGSLSAQTENPENYLDLKRYDKPGVQKPGLPTLNELRKKLQSPPDTGFTNLLAVAPNGNRVYALPQDNMPCVVPDMHQFNMPNASNTAKVYRAPEVGAIPNPGKGILILPQKRKK